MSEITKLYKNAGIEPIAEYCKHQCNNEFDDNACIGCKHIEKVEYPPFTKEKQIELIKLLAKGEVKINNEDDEYEFSIFNTVSNFGSFEESLADLTNRMWRHLTEREKQQVKGILE